AGEVDIPRRDIGPGTAAVVLVLDARGSASGRRERGSGPQPRLDAGFLVGREHEVPAAERRALPAPLVKVEHAARLGSELGIAGKDPAAVSPGTQGVPAEPAPERRAADLRHDSLGDDLPLNLADREARQRQAKPVRKLACERLNLVDDGGWHSGTPPRPTPLPPPPHTRPTV